MNGLVWIYRTLYVLVLVVFLANAVTRSQLSFSGEMAGVLLYFVSCIVLLATVLTTGIRHRESMKSIWTVTLAWCLLFSWYAWLSQSSPFLFREAHSLDAVQATAEAERYKATGGTIFALLLIWFLSFPLIQRYSSLRNVRSS